MYNHNERIVFSTGLPDGSVIAEDPSPAVPVSLLEEIWRWKEEGATYRDCLSSRLRCRTVPPGYTYTTWKPGKVLQGHTVYCI